MHACIHAYIHVFLLLSLTQVSC